MVETEGEILSVHLGPEWYVDSQDMVLHEHDRVSITGSRIGYRGQPAVIAAEVKKGDEILMLRDRRGCPLWRGWRRR
jgi:hypothetical protein